MPPVSALQSEFVAKRPGDSFAVYILVNCASRWVSCASLAVFCADASTRCFGSAEAAVTALVAHAQHLASSDTKLDAAQAVG